MTNPLIVQGPDGKPVFTGKEDPKNPPVKDLQHNTCPGCKTVYPSTVIECERCHIAFQGSKMQCKVCGGWFDYLVGEDIGDGRQGCEKCWKPPSMKGGVHGQEDPQVQETVFE